MTKSYWTKNKSCFKAKRSKGEDDECYADNCCGDISDDVTLFKTKLLTGYEIRGIKVTDVSGEGEIQLLYGSRSTSKPTKLFNKHALGNGTLWCMTTDPKSKLSSTYKTLTEGTKCTKNKTMYFKKNTYVKSVRVGYYRPYSNIDSISTFSTNVI